MVCQSLRKHSFHTFILLLIAGATLPVHTKAQTKKPNILVIFGDDVGITNISAYGMGVVGYKTPNLDRLAHEGMMFTDYYAENSCTAGRSTFITGQCAKRTGLSKVGIPGAPVGLQDRDITIAQALKPLGYATGQFGKNHLGDRNEYLPTNHGFDEFYGNRKDHTGLKTTRHIPRAIPRAVFCIAGQAEKSKIPVR